MPQALEATAAAWDFVNSFFEGSMTLPEAQTKLKSILAVERLDTTWERALSIANDFDRDDDGEASTARRALDELRANAGVSPSRGPLGSQPETQKPSQLRAEEADLQEVLDELKKRKLVRNPLPLANYLDPTEEQAVGEGVHELLTDADVVAAVRAEMADATAGDDEGDSDDEGKEEPIPPSEMLTLCDRLLAGCRDHAVGNLLDLTKQLMTVKREMRTIQAATVKQTSLTNFWKPVTKPGAAVGSSSAVDDPIVLD